MFVLKLAIEQIQETFVTIRIRIIYILMSAAVQALLSLRYFEAREARLPMQVFR